MQLRELRDKWDELSTKQKAVLFNSLTQEQKKMIVTSWEFMARRNQLAPLDWCGEKSFWVIVAGRGAGKTRTGAETTLDHIQEFGKKARVALISPTAADARDVMIEGESGILACAKRRGLKCTYEPSKRRITFKNGAIATSYTAEKPDRLRGPQHTFAWCDELSSWEYDQETWDMMQFGLRLGKEPKALITTTPKPKPLMKELLESPRSIVTRGSTYENKENLSPTFLKAVKDRYEGTRLGRQELYGEMLSDNPGALWQHEMIEDHRIKDVRDLHADEIIYKNNLLRIVVAIDPAVTTGENSDETGIVVSGVDEDGHLYVLEDRTGKYTPNQWGNIASSLYDKWKADRVVAEVNQGGEMVEHVLRTVSPYIPYRGVRAVKGKRARAEPIAALYEQGKVSHVGIFSKLEEQMLSYSPDNYKGSPDRVDALVWGLTDLTTSKRGSIHFI